MPEADPQAAKGPTKAPPGRWGKKNKTDIRDFYFLECNLYTQPRRAILYKNRRGAAVSASAFCSPAQFIFSLQRPALLKKKKQKREKKSVDMRVLSLVPVVAGLLATAEAHTRVYGVWINGVRIEAVELWRGVYMLTSSM